MSCFLKLFYSNDKKRDSSSLPKDDNCLLLSCMEVGEGDRPYQQTISLKLLLNLTNLSVLNRIKVEE